MAKGKDPAFLFYPGDASEDTQFMNRLERGCYFDLLKAQKKFRKFTIDLVRKVLGQDFEKCWPAIESVLVKEGDFYFIGWVNDAIENRAEHSAKQKKRIQEWWDKKKQSESASPEVHGNSTVSPNQNGGYSLESENGNEDENGNESIKNNESFKIEQSGFKYVPHEPSVDTLDDVTHWTNQVIEGNDVVFIELVRKRSVNIRDRLEPLARDHLDLCSRYGWHKNMTTQQEFRNSLLKHLIEQLNAKHNIKSGQGNTPTASATITGGKSFGSLRRNPTD
jgi:hypothetical protein